MEKSQFLEILRQRDALIDILILSHLKTLGRLYSLESDDGLRIARSQIIDHFAKDYMVDEKAHNETAVVLEMDIPDHRKIKFLSQLDGRTKRLSEMLTEMAASIRQKTLKDISVTNYETKY